MKSDCLCGEARFGLGSIRIFYQVINIRLYVYYDNGHVANSMHVLYTAVIVIISSPTGMFYVKLNVPHSEKDKKGFNVALSATCRDDPIKSNLFCSTLQKSSRNFLNSHAHPISPLDAIAQMNTLNTTMRIA